GGGRHAGGGRGRHGRRGGRGGWYGAPRRRRRLASREDARAVQPDRAVVEESAVPQRSGGQDHRHRVLTELVERDTDVSSRDPDRPAEDAEGDLPGLGLFRVAVPEEGPGLVPRPVGTGEVERRGLPGVGVEDLQRGTADRRVIAAAGARQGET